MSATTDCAVSLAVEVQNTLAVNIDEMPSEDELSLWASRAYQTVCAVNEHADSQVSGDFPNNNEVTIRLVDEQEIRQLNHDYRHKDKPTNVLSFPFEMPEGVDLNLLGDIVICHQVVLREAQSENKNAQQHYAHMVTHGVLHLCGYDHVDDRQADEMEALEAKILRLSGLPNPYQ